MKNLTFKGGIHPQGNKGLSIREPLREGALPKIAVIPLSQHIGAPNEPIVKKGDIVEEGAPVGTSGSFVSSPVHASVSGKVIDVKKAHHPAFGPVLSVFIERDEAQGVKSYAEKPDVGLSPRELVEKIKNAGIVGMGGAAFPTHVKLSPPEGKQIETLIINGAECEPYLTCDHALMTRETNRILKGVEVISRILSPKKIFFAIENNKKAALFAFEKAVAKASSKIVSDIQVVSLKTKYPQGGEKQLINAISGREVPPGKLPLDIGFMIQNVGTVHAIYEAVYRDKPLVERIVTISGDCIRRPGNYLIRIGTTIKEIVDKCGIGIYRDPKKVISGGPMMGIAQPHMDVPVLKSTSGILFLSEEAAKIFEEGQCIKCSRCVDVCPMRLIPTDMMKNIKKGYWDEASDLHVADCMECGSCTYACPARIPLVQYIKEGKAVLAARR